MAATELQPSLWIKLVIANLDIGGQDCDWDFCTRNTQISLELLKQICINVKIEELYSHLLCLLEATVRKKYGYLSSRPVLTDPLAL